VREQLALVAGVIISNPFLFDSAADIGPVIVQFYPVPGTTFKPPSMGCVTNVTSSAMAAYGAASPNAYFNVHNLENPEGVMRRQLAGLGVVPAGLPTPGQINPVVPANPPGNGPLKICGS
jgi:hypothetical protein